MLINDVFNKDELSALIISELKGLGVKYRKEKKSKNGQEKPGRKRIFRTHLHLLELTDVVLANGGIVQIPQFVSEACQRILEQVDTDGLFRKAGSTLRQREIRANLESGLSLGRSHHVIDVANVLKSFFRELPEPLLPSSLQEALLRSLLLSNGQNAAILMTCLLLPPLTINTLAFFMQFLHTVSLSAHQNRMSTVNLAIIFTPGLMPTPASDIQGIRLNNHVKVIEFLIENSESIGVLPERIAAKLTCPMVTPSTKSITDLTTDKKKKKRRSGSLTRMFNGFRKIVGAMGSSSENLENTLEHVNNSATPCLTKSAKKRKIIETSAFSAKKRKELVELLPLGGLLPNATPLCSKETKKHRLSVGGRRNLKYPLGQNPAPSIVERRWSIVGSGWSKKKFLNPLDKKQILKPLSPVVSLPCITDLDFPKMEFDDLTTSQNTFNSISSASITDDSKTTDSDFVRIPKSEYEAIKERVSSIEKRISQEYGNVRSSLLSTPTNSPPLSSSVFIDINSMSGPERVKNKFEKTCEDTIDMASSPSTDKLAKRLSRELKIHRSVENRIIRSPSARKIGTIRRRSREAVRVSRNNTWHISSTKNNRIVNNPNIETTQQFVNGISFYPKSNLKRGRPNTVQSGLQNRQVTTLPVPIPDNFKSNELFNNMPQTNTIFDEINIQESWTAAEDFFRNNLQTNISTTSQQNDSSMYGTPKGRKSNHQKSITPNFITTIPINDNTKTPMLPPKSIPRRNNQTKTPNSNSNNNKNLSAKKCGSFLSNRFLLSSPHDESQNGRASIARLRALNAGMVLAKTKLFDRLGNDNDIEKSISPNQTSLELKSSVDSREPIGGTLKTIKGCDNNGKQRTPRRKTNQPKSPGYIQKKQRFSSIKYPDRNLFTNIVQSELKIKPNSLRTFENGSLDSPTPRIKKSLKVNSPRILKTPRDRNTIQNSRTPLKATPIAIRYSPRLREKHFDI